MVLARIENDAGEVLLRREGLQTAAATPTNPGVIYLDRDLQAATEQGSVILENKFEAIVADAVLAIADATHHTTLTDVLERWVSKVKDAMRRAACLPQPTQGVVTGNIVQQLKELGHDQAFE